MNEFNVKDAVNFALNGNPLEFENNIHGLLAQRMQNAIDNKKEDLGSQMFNTSSEVEEVETEE